jgi:hypothetical protein
LSLGCALKRKSVGCEIVREVIADLDLDPLTENRIVVTESKPRLSIEEIPVSKHKNIAWVPKAMVATLLMLVLSGMSTESREVRGPLVHALQQPSKRAQPPLEVSSNSTRQMSGTLSRSRSLPPPAEAGTRNKTKTDSSAGVIDPPESVDWVSVPPGATLSQICAKVLATCRSMDIKTILHLNPWITNPDHLVSGKQLRIPIQEKISSAAGQLPVTSYANKVPMEAVAQ